MLRLFPALALVLSLGLAGPGTVSAAPLITVETAPGDDAAIIDGVKRTHAPDPRTKLFEVTAETSGGITVLKGRTDSAEALPDGRRGTIAVSAVEKLADFERREESERRSDPAAFMKALSETAVREAASGRHADGGSFLRNVFLARDLIVQRDPDMLLAAYPKADGGRSLDRFKPGDVLVFRPVNGVRAAGISLGGSRFVSAPDMGGDLRKGGAKARAALRKSLEGAVRIDPGFLNDPCLTSTRSNPYWQAPVKALVPCSRRADIEMIR